jgi:Ser/Thr protein kinase RdoA (MazF antagonist)
VPAADLSAQLVHGDVRLSNVRRTTEGETVYFDFGFLARRPRIHDLAYALAWMMLRPDGRGTAEEFAWETVPQLVTAYEDAARTTLAVKERRALAPYIAAVPLYLAALAGYTNDPVAHLRDQTRRTFLRIGEWLLARPAAVG